MLPLILSLIIFVIIGIMVSLIIVNIKSKRRERLMHVVRGEAKLSTNKKSAVSAQDQRRSDIAKKLKNSETSGKQKKGSSLNEKLQQAGVSITVRQFWVYSVISCIVVTGVAKVFGFSSFVIVMASIIGLLGLPRFILKRKINKRQKEFMEDFPEALESMMRLLKAGMPVSEAIKMVSIEFQGPMGDEMGRVYDQQKIGVPLPEAVLESAKRMPLTEVQMFATAIAIQTQTGSSLSEVLQNLASVIRSRFALRRKVKALSSEAKASAMIIGALPVVVASGMYFVNRDYIMVLFEEPTGNFLLGCAVAWMCVGVLVMRQMINFKV